MPELMPVWVDEVAKTLSSQGTHFAALHLQEVGGKKFASSKSLMKSLLQQLREHHFMKNFTHCFGYIDTDASNGDSYTALGLLYLVHKSIRKNTQRYNYATERFSSVSSDNDDGNSAVQYDGDCDYCVKRKFAVGQFGVHRKSRKGFMQTAWRIHDKAFQLVNVHLFPDTSNLELLQKTRDSNARSRREALEYILEESSRYPIVDKDAKLSQPDGRIREEGDNKRSRLSVEGRPRDAIFYFGDFNFRLDMSALVTYLTDGVRGKFTRPEPEKPATRCVFVKRGSREQLLLLEKKKFVVADRDKFDEVVASGGAPDGVTVRGKSGPLKQFDWEGGQFPHLYELPVAFPPSYPYKESTDVACAAEFNCTRAPAWCDRVLMSLAALDMISPRPAPAGDKNPKSAKERHPGVVYAPIGLDAVVGDHKPIALSFPLC